MKRDTARPSDVLPIMTSGTLSVSLEELEARLETQIACPPATLDDDHCLYYLCTTRCSGTKCPIFSMRHIVLE